MSGESTIAAVPLVARGRIMAEGGSERDCASSAPPFQAPNIAPFLSELRLPNLHDFIALQNLPFGEVVEYLSVVGNALHLKENRYIQAALAQLGRTSSLTEPLLRHQYEQIPELFRADYVHSLAEASVGTAYLSGWVAESRQHGAPVACRVRAFGARCLHVIAGNSPLIGALTIVRNAFTRSYGILKLPSNDPFTVPAIVRTMIDVAPNHPLTRHISAGYWRGGDEEVERFLVTPLTIDKLIAWGGSGCIQNAKSRLVPGIDLITFEPKSSMSIVLADGLMDEVEVRDIALRIALDVGAMNQEACFNSRAVFVVSTSVERARELANRLGSLACDALARLPESISARPRSGAAKSLYDEIRALRFARESYRVFGGQGISGTFIVSQRNLPIEFLSLLEGRVANIVPLDDVEHAVSFVDHRCQTVGIYPESAKEVLRDRLACAGAQRIVSLGGASVIAAGVDLQDGLEPVRRICRWVVQEDVSEVSPDLCLRVGYFHPTE